MCAALKFDSIVKAGLKFDPSGYGTTVWGVLSGVLTLVQNDKDRADAVFDSVEVLATFLPKYAIIEDHYLDRKTQHRNRFEDQIKNVYISILKYAARVQKELNRSLAGRVLGSFWELENQEIKILKDELVDNDEKVADECHRIAHQYRKQEFEELKDQALEALDQINLSVKKLLEAEKLRTLNLPGGGGVFEVILQGL
ncbi:hypothetical protein FJTKL_07491 [Diaporthe vaccinii]|uniref:DUF7708 domain-containing protein n=1 Tax=Diaporthe vaccinii TaxID=105482 RepID=A0ABR4ETK5_9PEZI